MTPQDSNKETLLQEASRIYFLPNLFTAGNLFFGFVAIIRCIQAHYTTEIDSELADTYYTHAVWAIFAAFVCDALDGRVARFGGRESLFGKEFDSIADVVSFGVAPAMMMFFLILKPTENYEFFRNVGWLIGFVYLLCAGVRLARFNVITHPMLADKSASTHNFVGLPVPVCAGFIASLVLVLIEADLQQWALILPILMLLIAYLMVSNILYPSFKSLDFHTHIKPHKFIFLIIAVAGSLFFFKQMALVVLFLGYIFYGPFRQISRYFKRSKGENNPSNNL